MTGVPGQGGGHADAVAYRGPERRNRVTQVRPVPLRRFVLGGAGVVAATALLLVPLSFDHVALRASADAVRLFAAVLAVIAGTAIGACWRAEGRAFDAWLGASLASFGVLLAGIVGVGSVAGTSPAGTVALELLVASSACGALAYQATISAPVEADVAPRWEASWVIAGGLGLVAAIAFALRRGALPGLLLSPCAGAVALTATTAAWGCCTCSAWLRRRGQADRHGMVAVLGLLTLAPGSWAVIGPTSPVGDLTDALLVLLAVTVAAVAGMEQLVQVLRFQSGRSLDLRTELDLVEGALERERVELDNRLHDLRNAVAAVRSADEALRGGQVALGDRARLALARAVSSELERLQVLIEPHRLPRVEELDLAEALDGVLAAERSLGTEVLAVLDGARVRSDRHALARAVQNLLANARRYAPGSPVVVHAVRTPHGVRLTVSDTGPGIPESERRLVFLRGARGSTAQATPGDGLGLHLAGELLESCGARLRLGDQPGPGATFVIELPAAGPAPAGEPVHGVPEPGAASPTVSRGSA